MAKLTLRIEFDNATQLGPGKVRLLEEITERGSISAAGRGMGMSYRRAWLLVDDLNHCFKEPLVQTQCGGSGGRGGIEQLRPESCGDVPCHRAGGGDSRGTRIRVLEQVLANRSPQ